MYTDELILKALVSATIEKEKAWKVFSSLHVHPSKRYDYEEYHDYILARDDYENTLALAKGWTGIS